MRKIVNRLAFAFATIAVTASLGGCFVSHREVKEQVPVVEPVPAPVASSSTTTTTTKSDDGAVQRSTTTYTAPAPMP